MYIFLDKISKPIAPYPIVINEQQSFLEDEAHRYNIIIAF